MRLGWGETGQQDGINNSYYAPLYYLAGAGAQFNFGNTFTQPFRPTAYNPDLRWETTQTLNLGLDYSIFAGRISGEIDVYQKKTKDLISTIDVAPGSNFDVTMTYNIGSLVNKGVEFSINSVPVRNKNLTWDLGFNITYNKAEITSLYNSDAPGYKGIQVSGISASLYAAVERPRRDLGVLRLLGLVRAHVFFFPVVQGAMIAVLGLGAGFGGYALLAYTINLSFASEIAPGEAFCALPAHYPPIAAAATLLLAVLASLIAAWRATRIDPAEAIRDQ